MAHNSKVRKTVLENFYNQAVLRGSDPVYVPLDQLEAWVESFGEESGEMRRLRDPEDCVDCDIPCGKRFACFEYQGHVDREFPPHYHDVDELFIVQKGWLTMEYINEHGKYARKDLKAGDRLRISAEKIHRATIHEHVVAKLLFKTDHNEYESVTQENERART